MRPPRGADGGAAAAPAPSHPSHPSPASAASGASAPPANPCLRCGACCASFRVDFDRAEWAGDGGAVPELLADPIHDRLCRLRGTDHARPRCAALVGRIGESVRCAIHEWRPSPCREFGLRAPLGLGDDACDAARRRHGLPPLGDPLAEA